MRFRGRTRGKFKRFVKLPRELLVALDSSPSTCKDRGRVDGLGGAREKLSFSSIPGRVAGGEFGLGKWVDANAHTLEVRPSVVKSQAYQNPRTPEVETVDASQTNWLD